MKWQGRRQSSNIVDVRGFSSITIVWIDEDDVMPNTGGICIHTDGYIQDLSAGVSKDAWRADRDPTIRLAYVSSWFSSPTMTTAQKEKLREILKSVSTPGLVIKSDSADLKEAAISIFKSM